MDFLILLGTKKFGPPNDWAKAWIGGLSNCNYLQYLSTRIPEASSWEDLLYNALPHEPETGAWDDPRDIPEAAAGATDSANPAR
jgi:hypothetical protein